MEPRIGDRIRIIAPAYGDHKIGATGVIKKAHHNSYFAIVLDGSDLPCNYMIGEFEIINNGLDRVLNEV
jgi:hypothetical protein